MKWERVCWVSDEIVCGVIIGEAKSSEGAEKIAGCYKNCPYVAFIASFSTKVVAVYFVPEHHLWWLKAVENDPKGTIGFETATLFTTRKFGYPREFTLRVPREGGDKAPCGADCPTCPMYAQCLGCPATIHYKGVGF